MQKILYSVWHWTWTVHTERERASAVEVHEVWIPFFCSVGSEVAASFLSVLDPFYSNGLVINLPCRVVMWIRWCHKVLIYNNQGPLTAIVKTSASVYLQVVWPDFYEAVGELSSVPVVPLLVASFSPLIILFCSDLTNSPV